MIMVYIYHNHNENKEDWTQYFVTTISELKFYPFLLLITRTSKNLS